MATGAEAEASPHEFPREVLGAASRRKRERAGEGKRKTEKKDRVPSARGETALSGPPPPAQLSLILWLCAVYYVQCTESERETAVHIHVLDDLLPSNSLRSTQPTSSVRQNLVQRRQWRRAITIRDQGGKGRMPGRKWERIPPFTSYSKAAFCFSPPFPPYPFKSEEEEEEERERRFISLMQRNDGGGPSSPFRERKSSGKKGEKLPFLPVSPFFAPQKLSKQTL